MRRLGLHGFKVETAGQSTPSGGSLVNMIGIVDTPAFRKAILDQRDRLARGGVSQAVLSAQEGAAADPLSDPQTHTLLTEIRDALIRIEKELGESGGD